MADRLRLRDALLATVFLAAAVLAPAQAVRPDAPPASPPESGSDPVLRPVDVTAEVDDTAIASRLRSILEATEWYVAPEVRVEEGVVFMSGEAVREGHRDWATRLARNTEGVVAVVNTMHVRPRSMWDLSETWVDIRTLAREAIRQSPLVLLALVLLVASWLVASTSSRVFRAAMRRRWTNGLLRTMVGNAIGVLVFILGLYFVLRISGLTRLAVTVLGGTGLFGLVVGFAFRDIAENFLASLLMSIQRPFLTGDLIEVVGIRGYVQQVNSRSTILMTFDGNHVQIPNATVYKEKITNFWANPQMRCSFPVGIGYDDAVSKAQEVGVRVLRGHPAVLDEPEPAVLVESLGAATVNLRFWFWINVRTHSEIKVRSALLRLSKRAFQEAGISMPDEAREIVFPHGVPVKMVQETPGSREGTGQPGPSKAHASPPEDAAASGAAEGGDGSEATALENQARTARMPEGGRNLLEEDPAE